MIPEQSEAMSRAEAKYLDPPGRDHRDDCVADEEPCECFDLGFVNDDEKFDRTLPWTRPSLGEWDLADFLNKEHADALLMDLGYCVDCGFHLIICACGGSDA